jgi:hypothetical protein
MAMGRPRKEGIKAENFPHLNFRVEAAFRRRFRQAALDGDVSLIGLLHGLLDFWEAQGCPPLPSRTAAVKRRAQLAAAVQAREETHAPR